MTREGLELVRRAYDAWDCDDFEAARSLLHPGVEWRTSGAFRAASPVIAATRAGVSSGRPQLTLEYFTIELEPTIGGAGTVVAAVRPPACGSRSAAPQA